MEFLAGLYTLLLVAICLLQADGHQQNRIQKRKKSHEMSPYKIQDPGRADAKPGPFAFYSVS